jgi:hypothetical protein
MPLADGGDTWFWRGARTERRAFLRDFIDGRDELYDVHADFDETKNLVSSAAERETRERLGKQISGSLLGNLPEVRPR